MSDFDRKLRFLAKQVAWCFAFLLFLPFWLFGIFTGVQYKNDDCVKNGPWALELDYWLTVACIYDIFFSCIVLLLLCCHARGSHRKWIVYPMHAINLVWLAVGVALIVESNFRCQHNTLWVISIVDVSTKGFLFVSIFAIWMLSRMGMCRRLGSYISFEETQYGFQLVESRDEVHQTDEQNNDY